MLYPTPNIDNYKISSIILLPDDRIPRIYYFSCISIRSSNDTCVTSHQKILDVVNIDELLISYCNDFYSSGYNMSYPPQFIDKYNDGVL